MNLEGISISEHVHFNHDLDCVSCTFLGCAECVIGSLRANSVDFYDLYFCGRCDGGTIIIRCGDEGHDYVSASVDTIPTMFPLANGETTRTRQMYVIAMHLALLKLNKETA